MLLVDRVRVVSRKPRVHIGRRACRQPDGTLKPYAVWWAVWCASCRQFEVSLRTEVRSEAIRAARALAKTLRKDGTLPPPPPDPDIQQLVDQYVQYQLDRGHAPKTVGKYKLVLGVVADWAKGDGVAKATAFDERRYWAFHRWMADQGYGAKTRYDRLVLVKQLFKWAARTQAIQRNPISGADLPQKPAPTVQPCFSPSQVGALLSAADETYRPVFASMAYAGLRFGEVRDLEWDDVRFGDGTSGSLLIRRGGSTGTTKTGRNRRIPLHPALRSILETLPRRTARVFVYQHARRGAGEWHPLEERVTLMALKGLCATCGFESPQRFKLHSLRHSFCSMCARSNVPYKYALVWLGHTSSDMLDYYFHAFDNVAEAAIRTIAYPTPQPQTSLDYCI